MLNAALNNPDNWLRLLAHPLHQIGGESDRDHHPIRPLWPASVGASPASHSSRSSSSQSSPSSLIVKHSVCPEIVSLDFSSIVAELPSESWYSACSAQAHNISRSKWSPPSLWLAAKYSWISVRPLSFTVYCWIFMSFLLFAVDQFAGNQPKPSIIPKTLPFEAIFVPLMLPLTGLTWIALLIADAGLEQRVLISCPLVKISVIISVVLLFVCMILVYTLIGYSQYKIQLNVFMGHKIKHIDNNPNSVLGYFPY